jgi:hypothetical protein
MGYSYGTNERGNWCLACDNCGEVGGVRKRTCPEKVYYPNGSSLPYCYPAALCSACYAKLKGTLHANCKRGAAKENALQARRGALLDAGAYLWRGSYGEWHESVPAGMVGMVFENASRDCIQENFPRYVYEMAQERNPEATTLEQARLDAIEEADLYAAAV